MEKLYLTQISFEDKVSEILDNAYALLLQANKSFF